MRASTVARNYAEALRDLAQRQDAVVAYGVLASSGYVAHIDVAACNGCGICLEPCPFDALSLEGELASVKWASCMGCGVCTGQCPLDAVSLVRDELKGIPLDVTSLAPVIERDW